MRTVEVTDELQEYMDGLVPKRDRVLARMEEEAHRENIPIVDAHEGMLLYLLVKMAGAKRILELGTAIGYSGIWLLRGRVRSFGRRTSRRVTWPTSTSSWPSIRAWKAWSSRSVTESRSRGSKTEPGWSGAGQAPDSPPEIVSRP